MASRRRPGPTLRRRVVMAFCCLWIAAQTLVPLWLLTRPRPARFGWQMYSALGAELELEVIDTRGGRRPLAPRAYVLRPRRDLPLAQLLPPHLCRVLPEAAAIAVREGRGAPPRRFPCR